MLLALLLAAAGRSRRSGGGALVRVHHGNRGRVSGTGEASPTHLAHAPAAVGTGVPWPEWPQTRYAAALAAMPHDVPDDVRARVALALVAHWDLETDGGGAEWGFNLGNIRRFPSYHADGTVHGDTGPAQTLSDALPYRRYATLADGARDYLALVSHAGYARPVFRRLVAGELDPGQYAAALANAGYSTHLTPAGADARARDVNARAGEIRAALASAAPLATDASGPAARGTPDEPGPPR